MNFRPYLSARKPPIMAPTAAPKQLALIKFSYPKCTSVNSR